MPSPNSLKRFAAAALVLVAGLALRIPRQAALEDARRALAGAQAEQSSLANRMTNAKSVIESSRPELAAQSARRNQQIAATARLQQEILKAKPESRWAEPPAHGASWDPASPYVWLPKDLLAKLPLARFDRDGSLSKNAVAVLDLDPRQVESLNVSLKRAVDNYHAAQLPHLEKTDGPADLPNGDRSITVKVPPIPEAGAAAQQQFENAVRTELAGRRAEVLLQANTQWLDSQFDQDSDGTVAYTLTSHTNGQFTLQHSSSHGGGSSTSPGGSVLNSVPTWLHPLFTDLAPQAAGETGQGMVPPSGSRGGRGR